MLQYLASIDNLENDWLLLVFLAHKLLYNTIPDDCTLRQHKRNSNNKDDDNDNDDNNDINNNDIPVVLKYPGLRPAENRYIL